MTREGNLIKNTVIITIGKICTQLITFLLLPIYTAVLSTEEYGIVDLLNTLVMLAIPLITFQIEQAVFRNLIEERNNEEKKEKIISTGFFTIVFQISIFLIIFAISSIFIKNEYKYFLLLNVIVYIFMSFFQQISRGLGDNLRYSLGSFISALFTIIFNILLVVFVKMGAYGMLIGTFVGQAISSLYYFASLKLRRYIKFKYINKEVRKEMLKYSLPLIPNAISWWVFNASDRVIVTIVLGASLNGILAAALKFSSLFANMYGIFNMSWTESVTIAISDKDFKEYFMGIFDKSLRIFFCIAVCLISVMPFTYPLLINSNYSAGYNLVPISIIGVLFNIIVGLISVIYVAYKNTRAIANTSFIAAIINIAVHVSLIKYIGLYAAVISTLVAFLAMCIYRLYDIKKRYFSIKIGLKDLSIGTVILAIALLSFYSGYTVFQIVDLIFIIIFSCVVNYDFIFSIIKSIKGKLKKGV